MKKKDGREEMIAGDRYSKLCHIPKSEMSHFPPNGVSLLRVRLFPDLSFQLNPYNNGA